ncbi:hypothetical protein L6452_18066 [Arctium lappa]|uniref:Uncharacterized protein n=1 Tax=Arctium lappa TaxID=4217 RepID=A0ACB9C542_ARCLA|nr:hypothetical protein L6452_18066 [Arctium lappa]
MRKTSLSHSLLEHTTSTSIFTVSLELFPNEACCTCRQIKRVRLTPKASSCKAFTGEISCASKASTSSNDFVKSDIEKKFDDLMNTKVSPDDCLEYEIESEFDALMNPKMPELIAGVGVYV